MSHSQGRGCDGGGISHIVRWRADGARNGKHESKIFAEERAAEWFL
ncbi:hypothetical protein [Streptomyces qinglanensis]|nr:hypothetical protein [Streptomyces qinglanensis]